MARKRTSKADQEIVDEAMKRLDRAREYQATAHAHYREDMKFANGDDENLYQWNDQSSAARRGSGRPCLTVNKTRVHCLQVINDARQNQVQVRINPTGDDATYEAGQIFEGIVRHIEYISNAQQAYANATYSQVMGGIGYWRVLVDYAHDDTFDQEIFIRRIPDPTSVYMDPDIQQADGSDAKWAFVFYELTREEYEAEYGDDDETVLNSPALSGMTQGAPHRTDEHHVQLVEYYRVGEKNDRLLQIPDDSGRVQLIRESRLPPGLLDDFARAGIFPIAERDIAEPEVEVLIIANDRIVSRKDWPGRFVPIVRVPCEEIVLDGRVDWISHVRHLRDPQRLYNWYTSQAAEFVALQTKVPFVAVAEAVEDHLKQWEAANTENKAVLLYKGKDDQNQPIPPPTRAQPPVMAQAYLEGLKISQGEMMMASGQYQAVMGEPGNETSGKAINARQRQGDNATYHVIDRLASAIRYTGRIIVDLVPRVYDTKRVMMILGEDGTQTQVHIDPEAEQAHQTTLDPDQPPAQPQMNRQTDPDAERSQALRTIFNPRIGRYAVVADVGPAYATKRQESFNAFNTLISANKDAFAIVGDFWARNADFPGADELAARLKQGIPPQYRSGGPSPEEQQLQQQLDHTTKTAQDLLQKADAETSMLKAQVTHLQEQLKDRSDEIQIKDYSAETERLKVVGGLDPIALSLVVRQLVGDMLQTDLPQHLAAHAAQQGGLQALIAPPQAPAQGNGAAGPAMPAPPPPDPASVPPGAPQGLLQ